MKAMQQLCCQFYAPLISPLSPGHFGVVVMRDGDVVVVWLPVRPIFELNLIALYYVGYPARKDWDHLKFFEPKSGQDPLFLPQKDSAVGCSWLVGCLVGGSLVPSLSHPGGPENLQRLEKVRFVQVALLDFAEDLKHLTLLEEYMSLGLALRYVIFTLFLFLFFFVGEGMLWGIIKVLLSLSGTVGGRLWCCRVWAVWGIFSCYRWWVIGYYSKAQKHSI